MPDDEKPQRREPTVRVDPAGGYAYRPGRVVLPAAALGRLAELLGEKPKPVDEPSPDRVVVTGVEDVPGVVRRLRAEGIEAQPDHVLFASCGDGDPCGCRCTGCGPHPAVAAAYANAVVANPLMANPLMANPLMANPLMANPLMANPLMANPLMANPLMANPLMANAGPKPNTARPAAQATLPTRSPLGKPSRVLVLDTGLAEGTPLDAGRITGDRDVPDRAFTDLDGTQHGVDRVLDPAAGHGTFIAGIIEALAPGCTVTVQQLVSPAGDASESAIAKALFAAAHAREVDLVCLSLGGPALDLPFLLRDAVAACIDAGLTMVAAAGNSGTCVPHYPAAFDDVLAVGALGPCGPAPWSNYGPWVDACAPGTDLVSTFFPDFDGPAPVVDGVDPDAFRGLATWSGTSFAAPVVVAAIAREADVSGVSVAEAARLVVEGDHRLHIAGMGTVVNL